MLKLSVPYISVNITFLTYDNNISRIIYIQLCVNIITIFHKAILIQSSSSWFKLQRFCCMQRNRNAILPQ